ncbi:MAG: hypothetical protein IT581_04365 [Verrucomicrobiales bacterium]|nr:hypothetical protein [Verrucomicrobiales bacterium]
MKPEIAAQRTSSKVRSWIPQHEVNAEFVMSGYGAGGGIIGAFIDAGVNSGRQKNAEARVQELRKHVRDLDARAVFQQELAKEVGKVEWINTGSFETIADPVLPKVTKEMVGNGAVVTIGTSYRISQDCRVLVVSSGIDYYAKGKYRQPLASVLVAYHSKEIGQPDGEGAIALWAANDGAAFREVIREAVAEDVKLVRHALDVMGAGEPKTKTRRLEAVLLHARGDFGIKMSRVSLKGTVVEESADRIIFRAKTGQFFSLPMAEVKLK